jgi:hypothetical protein
MARLALACLALLLISGCGATKQFMIPYTPEGDLAGDPKAKLRLSICANCYMWRGETESPRGFLTIHDGDLLRVEIHTTYRCFGWLLMIPVPIWSSCSASVREPGNQILRVRVSNKSDGALILKGGKARAFSRDDKPLPVRGNQQMPEAIPANDFIQFSIGLGDWSDLGWGYQIDFSAVSPQLPKRITFERFTSTTFGLLYLD